MSSKNLRKHAHEVVCHEEQANQGERQIPCYKLIAEFHKRTGQQVPGDVQIQQELAGAPREDSGGDDGQKERISGFHDLDDDDERADAP